MNVRIWPVAQFRCSDYNRTRGTQGNCFPIHEVVSGATLLSEINSFHHQLQPIEMVPGQNK